MRIKLSLLFMLSNLFLLKAGKIDELFFNKITGTKWELTEEKNRNGIFLKKNKKIIQETITFSAGAILFDLSDANYACNYVLKNHHDLWLTCAEPDQFIYRIHSLNNRKMVIDVFVKSTNGKYIKRKRLTFHILLA